MRVASLILLSVLTLTGMSGCARIGYYAQLAGGQWRLLQERRPIAEVVRSQDTAPAVRTRLQGVLDARSWAVSTLQLPDNGSYTVYADVGRPYVMWNVFATPELSLAPVEQCFLFAGCVAYQGYYARADAEARANELRAQGYDVYVGGVPAYSTLGWFDDPVLNTMMNWDDAQLVGTVFHELAHQKLYVRDDTRFNESYAAFVQEEGVREYRGTHPGLGAGAPLRRSRREQFVQLVIDARRRLADLYRQKLDVDTLRRRKAEAFARLRSDYEHMRDTVWQGDHYYDGWFADDRPNNAKLLPFGLYDEYQPAFAALFEQEGCDWKRFHAEAGRLARLDTAQRSAALDALLRQARPQ